MGVHDLSSNKCYPLTMPNEHSDDLRMKLECRTGASIDIYNSRIFVFGGCVLEVDIKPYFTLDDLQMLVTDKIKTSSQFTDLQDFNSVLSNECFRLSLINRKWFHYNLGEPEEMVGNVDDEIDPHFTGIKEIVLPDPRMCHAMAVNEKFLYISGGVNFSDQNELQILNDLWMFDTIKKEWKCIYPNGNKVLQPRFDHLLCVLPTLEIFDKSLLHPGLLICGGLTTGNLKPETMEFYDLVGEKCQVQHHSNFNQALQYKDGSADKMPLFLRKSLNNIYPHVCRATNDTKIVIFDKSPDTDQFEPILIFSDSKTGYRFPHIDSHDIDMISDIKFPTIGLFGESVILIGYVGNETKISSFLFNYRTSTWTKIQISCMHKIYSHKLSEGFVWQSHHKIAFLGKLNINDSSGIISYFDNIVVVSLPFTNFFAKKPSRPLKLTNTSTHSLNSTRSQMELKYDSEPIPLKRTESGSSFNSNKPKLPYTNSSTALSNAHSDGFAGYAYHVAQQIQVNSIRSVLPSYAIAIGKNAFERNTSFSDFEFVCSDGSVIPVPITLCRRRWGVGFDQIFADGYAKAYLEGNANTGMSFSRNVSASDSETESLSSSINRGDYTSSKTRLTNPKSSATSIKSSHTSSAPNFRLPFQDGKENGNEAANSKTDLSPIRNMLHKSSFSSRNNSVSGVYPSLTLQRASLSLSKSRRNSHTISTSRSRDNSVGYLPSRRSSLNSAQFSRRNSLGVLPSHAQFTSNRRDSILSKSSTNSVSSPKPRDCLGTQRKSQSSIHLPCSPHNLQNSSASLDEDIITDTESDISINGTTSNDTDLNDETISSHVDMKSFDIKDVPPSLPMPIFPPQFRSKSDANEYKSKPPMNALTMDNDPYDVMLDNSLNNAKSQPKKFNDKSHTNTGVHNMEHNLKASNEYNASYLEIKFNPLRIPRSLYLPYPKTSVKAIVEYFYSGQIGANWKLFPTGIDLLLATKELNIPLLYDLVLELFFVVLSVMEGMFRTKLIKYLEDRVPNLNPDELYNILDVKGKDDSDLDWNLLLEAARSYRRDSGSTINSDMKCDDDEIENEDYENIDLSDLGPTDLIRPHLHNVTNLVKAAESMDKKFGESTDDKENELENLPFKLTAATLNEIGYQISDYEIQFLASLKNITDNSDINKSFKKFRINGTKNDDRKNADQGIREWPTFKELLSEENVDICSNSIIDLFIETSALISDNKLMLQSLHVQSLYKKIEEIMINNGEIELLGKAPQPDETNVPNTDTSSTLINKNTSEVGTLVRGKETGIPLPEIKKQESEAAVLGSGDVLLYGDDEIDPLSKKLAKTNLNRIPSFKHINLLYDNLGHNHDSESISSFGSQGLATNLRLASAPVGSSPMSKNSRADAAGNTYPHGLQSGNSSTTHMIHDVGGAFTNLRLKNIKSNNNSTAGSHWSGDDVTSMNSFGTNSIISSGNLGDFEDNVQHRNHSQSHKILGHPHIHLHQLSMQRQDTIDSITSNNDKEKKKKKFFNRFRKNK